MTYECEGQLTMFDQDTWFGRMFQEPSQVETPKEQTSRQSLKKSSKSKTKVQLMCLSLKGDGATQAYSWETDSALLGEYMMRNFGEYPNEERESHLSQILTDNAQEKYFLSQKSCQGILTRADRRGKKLPDILRQALENQMHIPFKSEVDVMGGAKEP